jgi:hypothetical protein
MLILIHRQEQLRIDRQLRQVSNVSQNGALAPFWLTLLTCELYYTHTRMEQRDLNSVTNGIARIRHQSRKTTALSCYRYLIKTSVEKMNNI